MTTISEHYNLGKSQLELDFVDVFVGKNLGVIFNGTKGTG